MAGLGWHEPMRDECSFRNERVACGKESCSTCGGKRPAHGPYWYAYWETGGRRHARMHKRYIGRASATATPDELRAIFEQRQRNRAEAAERKRRRDTRSDASGSRSGSTSGGSTGSSGAGGSTAGAGARERSGSAGGDDRNRSGRSYGSDRNKSDPFSRRRPPPIEEDFETIGSRRGVTFDEARQAYKDAARKHHPDQGGDPEVMKRVNAAWERIKQSFGRV